MKRISTTAGFANPTSKTQYYRFCSTASSSWTGPFRLFDLPSEIRDIIYHKVFTPSISDIDPTEHNTVLRLTFISSFDAAVIILGRTPGRIHILRPTNFASFALASKRIYKEALPILARHTTLHLSGADYDYFRTTFHPCTFTSNLLQEVAKHTPHVVVEASILVRNTKFQDQIVSMNTFPRLRCLTVYTCGPAEVTLSSVHAALSAHDAERLLAKKSWPTLSHKKCFGSILDQERAGFNAPALEGGKTYPVVLQELRSRFIETEMCGSRSEPEPKEIRVVYKLPLKNTIISANRTGDDILDVSEITVDFDSNTIIDVSFHMMENVPACHRTISTALAILDKPFTRPVARRPKVARAKSVITYRPPGVN